MSAGKLASQVAHATYMALQKQKKVLDAELCKSENDIIDAWRESGMCVIVLGCKDQLELMQAAKYLEQWNVPNHLYIDEGYSETPPLTATALATGVLDDGNFDWMFARFERY